ncbi:hypothetical protein ACUIJN_23725 [Metabacillus halosaccharovorans]|uniref:hypothetical protein n=1 Tax=Metabacillus halosaccharovorans TaxID=930124 RepID=UPI00403DB5B2
MFTGFDLSLEEFDSSFKEHGNKIFNLNKKRVEKELTDFLESDGSINGTSMQNNWFPQFEADVFISHSHNDYEKAITLAGWLNQVFNLDVFIDSCVWGSADMLLKKIDDRYCWMSDVGSYSYENRNYSTSHVHAMLSTALNSMIDKSECLIFLNTPNSINTKEVVQQKTNSPWIYLEIGFSQLIRKKAPNRKLIKKAIFEAAEKELTINYNLETKHLLPLNIKNLYSWKEAYDRATVNLHPLDVLYNQYKLIKVPSLILD